MALGDRRPPTPFDWITDSADWILLAAK